jgi:hypothetical protein
MMSAGTVCTGGMGVDTHMIAGVHACLTLPQTDLHLPIQTTPHYDEVLHPTACCPEHVPCLVLCSVGGTRSRRSRNAYQKLTDLATAITGHDCQRVIQEIPSKVLSFGFRACCSVLADWRYGRTRTSASDEASRECTRVRLSTHSGSDPCVQGRKAWWRREAATETVRL